MVETVIPLIPFYFVRHGETDRNKEKIYQGGFDAPLNETGLAQAARAAAAVQGLTIATLAVSPLERARKTAELLATTLAGHQFQVVNDLREVCLGELEGQPFGDHAAIHAWEAGALTPAGAESFEELKRRVRVAMHEVLAMPGPVLIVGHARFYSALESLLGLRGEKKGHVGNCAILFHEPPAQPGELWMVREHVRTERTA